MVHLNNAGSSLPPEPVVTAVIDHLRLEAELGGYEAEAVAGARVMATYDAVARIIGARSSEIALVENATRAWDMAFYSIPFDPGDSIITGVSEYASNYLAYLQLRQQKGVRIVVCPDDGDGQIDVEALDKLCDGSTRLIAITHMPTNGGLVNPVREIGSVARRRGVLYLLDACQSVGQTPIDVDEIGCDFLSATGRKYLRGPRGTGFLFARTSSTAELHPPFVDLHAASWVSRDEYRLALGATRFENWESYVAGRIGLGVACEYASAIGLEVIERRVRMLADRLRAGLAGVAGVRALDKGSVRSGIVTFAHDRRDARDLSRLLRQRGVNTSVSSRPSTRLDFDERGIDDVVRASVHYFNTDAEVDRLIAEVGDMVKGG